MWGIEPHKHIKIAEQSRAASSDTDADACKERLTETGPHPNGADQSICGSESVRMKPHGLRGKPDSQTTCRRFVAAWVLRACRV